MKIKLRSLYLIVLTLTLMVVVFPVTGTSAACEDDPVIKIEPVNPQIRVGNLVEVTITSSEPITPADVSWSNSDFVKAVKSEQRGEAVVSTLRAESFSPTNVEMTVTVKTVSRTVQITTLTSVLPSDFPADPPASFRLTQDKPKTIGINNLIGVTIPSDGLEVTSSAESKVTVSRSKTSIVISPQNPGDARIAVTSNGRTVKTYDVTVDEAVDSLDIRRDSIEINEKQTYALSNLSVEVKGKSQGDLTAANTPTFSTNIPEVASVSADNKTLTAHRPPTPSEGRVTLDIKAGSLKRTIPINVRAAANTISLGLQKPVVFVDRRESFTVSIKDSLGAAMPNIPVTWTYSDAASQECLKIVSQGNTDVTVQGIKPCPIASLTATPAASTGLDPVTLTLAVRDATPTGFAPLQIRIDLLDLQTAKDLFGRRAADEFFISKIRLFNKLKNQNGEYGDSILVYSESLEVRVQLEMRDKKGGDWKAIPTGSKDDNNQDTFYSLFGSPEPFPPDVKGTPPCQDNPQKNFVARYRPYTFDIVANTHDRRDERSTRSRILSAANGLSSLASFVTTVAVPGPSNDTILGLDQFKGLLIPSFEKLFPSLKEVQRQNIISMVMRPLEEIPFGSDVTRILFIPKGKLYGMIPGKVFRIGGVSTLGACAEVGIVKKAGSSVL